MRRVTLLVWREGAFHISNHRRAFLNYIRAPGPIADDFVATTFAHYDAFWELREHFRGENIGIFNLTAKGHQAAHTALLSSALNPRSFHRLCDAFVFDGARAFLYVYVWHSVCGLCLCLRANVHICLALTTVMHCALCFEKVFLVLFSRRLYG